MRVVSRIKYYKNISTPHHLTWFLYYRSTAFPTQIFRDLLIMGTNPRDSAVNKYCQSWDVHNLFIVGASVFPHNAAYNPTGLVGALAYWAADAIKQRYLPNPGPLVPA